MFYDAKLNLKTTFSLGSNNTTAAISDVVDLRSIRDVAGGGAVVRITCKTAPVVTTEAGGDLISITSANTTSEVLTAAGHGLKTGTPVVLSNFNTFDGPVAGTTYYAIVLSASTLALAATFDAAVSGTPYVNITADGTADLAVAQSPVSFFQFALVTASDAALTTDATILLQSPPFGISLHNGGFLPSVGDTIELPIPPSIATSPQRYLGVMLFNVPLYLASTAPAYTVATYSAGAFRMEIVTLSPNRRIYPDGL